MKMERAFQKFLVEIEVRKYTPKTIRSYQVNLNLFLCFRKEEREFIECILCIIR